MVSKVIGNGKNVPLNANSGTVPDMSGALLNWFQPMQFGVVVTTVENFQSVQTTTPVDFQGVWQPLTGRRLELKPEGQRAWSWWWLHADPSLQLKVDSIVIYKGKQYRVMAKKNYELYKYVEYELVTDWTGSGPEIVESEGA